MGDTSIQSEVDELLRRSQALREAGYYTESWHALRAAAELIDRYADDPPRWPDGSALPDAPAAGRAGNR